MKDEQIQNTLSRMMLSDVLVAAAIMAADLDMVTHPRLPAGERVDYKRMVL
jgi:hypothetical protein